MISLPNVLAGILIGILNNSPSTRISASLIWGIVFVIYTTIAESKKKNMYLEKLRDQKRTRLGLSPQFTFYFIEYFVGAITALVVSLLVGVVKDLF